MEQVNNNNIEEKLSTLNSQLSTNIYPIFDRMMTREDKERLLKQRSVMVWFTGLSGSGTVSYTHLTLPTSDLV